MTASPAIQEPELESLCESVGGAVLRKNVPLASCGTFRLGGICRFVLDCLDGSKLPALASGLAGLGLPFELIGSGSNILFSDAGWDGVIIRFDDNDEPTANVGDDGRLDVPASMNLDRLVCWTLEQGWGGLEAFSGIPGTVGGAVVGNAGAWGVQAEHVLERVQGCARDGTPFDRTPDECGFRYRHSALKGRGDLISSVVFRLQRGDSGELLAERARILALREEKHPDLEREPCIGSIFKNIEPTSAAERRQAAGWFLEQAGAKSMQVGGASVFHKHANIVINSGVDCRAQDVADLIAQMAEAVREDCGLQLEREVRFLGRFRGAAEHPGFF